MRLRLKSAQNESPLRPWASLLAMTIPEGAAGPIWVMGGNRSPVRDAGRGHVDSPGRKHPINRMQDPVPFSRFREIKEGATEKAFTCFVESQAHRVVHSAGNHDLQLTAIRSRPIDMRSAGAVRPSVRELVRLFPKTSLVQ